jgi:5-methylcytosine-specific restriction endonuclease McrA
MERMSLGGHVLVLNQNYEPMTVCHVKKAIVLIFLGKAEVIEIIEGKAIRSVSKVLPYPSIVRLSTFVLKRRKGIMLSRKNILKRDGYQCQYCGTKNQPMTVDHIIPKVRGGRDTWENLITACIQCNNKKGDQTPDEVQMKLQSKPRKPHPLSFIQHHAGISDERWKPYLFMA